MTVMTSLCPQNPPATSLPLSIPCEGEEEPIYRRQQQFYSQHGFAGPADTLACQDISAFLDKVGRGCLSLAKLCLSFLSSSLFVPSLLYYPVTVSLHCPAFPSSQTTGDHLLSQNKAAGQEPSVIFLWRLWVIQRSIHVGSCCPISITEVQAKTKYKEPGHSDTARERRSLRE